MPHRTRLLLLAAAALCTVALPGCGDNPFAARWTAQPDTALLHSLARPELNLNSVFDFVSRRPRRLEAPGSTGNWDVAVDTRDGSLVFLGPRAFDIESEAGIVRFEDMSFEDVREAPSDSAAYSYDTPVPISTGSTYVIQTREARGSFGRFCFFYGKLEPLEVRVDVGTVRFLYDVNTVCDDRDLVPELREEG